MQRIMAAVPAGVVFTPLMTLYLTDRTTYVISSISSSCGGERSVFGVWF